MYAYAESPDASLNFNFFVEHGLHPNADWVFVMNGPYNVSTPEGDNVRVIERPNRCFDMGAYGDVFTREPHLRQRSARIFRKCSMLTRADSYKKFIFMNVCLSAGQSATSCSEARWP